MPRNVAVMKLALACMVDQPLLTREASTPPAR